MPRAKDSTVGLLVVLASIAMFLAVLSAYARRTLADTDQFANRGTAALRDPAVRALTAERVTDQLVLERRSGLTTVRPLVMRAVSAALGSRAFVNAFRAGLRDVHRALFASDRNTLTLTISHVGPIIAGRLAVLHPSAAPAVERANQVELIRRDVGSTAAGVARAVDRVAALAFVLLGLAFGLAVAALMLSGDQRRTIGWLAIGVTCDGAVLLLVLTLGRTLVRHQVDAGAQRDAAGAVWDAFLGDLRAAGWVMAVAGALVAAAALPRPRVRLRHAAVGAVTAAVLAGAMLAAFVMADDASEQAPAPGPCLGHVQLCSRSLAQVVLAATHNSMSAPLPGWYASQQDRPIAAQLRDGIRGLLIDTHYADRLPNGRLRTVLGSRTEALSDSVSPAAIERARHLRERGAFKGDGVRGMYLCHSFCELGGTPLEPTLRELSDFLVANPGAIVVVVNEDYVAADDFVAAVEKAGLGKLAYRGPVSGDLPTLRQMIDSDQRVVFLAENHAGAAPWYRLAYGRALQETPFSFRRADQLTDPSRLEPTCQPNRGPSSAPLFLLNHWVTTDPLPQPRNAAAVNAYGPLLHRIEQCQRIRHHVVNLVAVDFYGRGDLFRVVDHLNGVR